jgi:hypothetical protein
VLLRRARDGFQPREPTCVAADAKKKEKRGVRDDDEMKHVGRSVE